MYNLSFNNLNFNHFNSINQIIVILFFLLPFAIVFSRFFADAIISINSLLFIFLIIKKKKYIYFKYKIVLFFFLWCLYLILVSLYSANILLSLESSLFYFSFGFFVLCFLILSKIENNFLKKFSFIYFCLLAIVFFDSYFQYFFNFNIFGYPYNGVKLSSFFKDEEILGSFLSRTFFIPIIGYLLLKEKIYYENLLLFSYIIIILSIIILSGERTAFFILFLNLSILALSYKNILKKNIIYLVIGVLMIISLLYLDKSSYKRIFIDTFNQFDFKIENNSQINFNIFSSTHTLHYSTAYNMFKDKPIFGHGPKMFRELCSASKYVKGYYINKDNSKYWLNINCSTHPHNTYVQLLSEIGIVGIVPVLLIFLYCLIIIIKKIFLNNFEISNISFLCITMIFSNLWPVMPSGNFFNNWLSIIYYLPVAILFYENFKNKT